MVGNRAYGVMVVCNRGFKPLQQEEERHTECAYYYASRLETVPTWCSGFDFLDNSTDAGYNTSYSSEKFH